MTRLLSVIAALLLAAHSGFAYEMKVNPDDLELTKYTRLVPRGNKKILQVRVPKGAKDAAGHNCAYLPVDIEPFIGEAINVSVMVRAKNIEQAGGRYPGVTFLLQFKEGYFNRERYVGERLTERSFEWKEMAFSETVPVGSTPGRLRLGLEFCSGEAEFDLATLKIKILDNFDREDRPLTAEETRDLTLLEQRMRDFLIGKEAVSETRIRENLAKLRPDGSYSDIDYADQNRSVWAAAKHGDYTIELARAWAKPGHPDYGKPELADAVKRAVAYWAKLRPQNTNWWWNDMAVPQKYAEILLMTPELFPEGPEREAAIDICRQAKFLRRYTGHNRVFIANNVFKRGLLERNPKAVNDALEAILSEISMPPMAQTGWDFSGIRYDGCYHQHGPQIQFGNYGNAFFADISFWSNMLDGTRWQLNEQQWEMMRLLAFDGYQWVLWNCRMDLLAIGRQLGRNSQAGKGRGALTSFGNFAKSDRAQSERYLEVLQRNRDGVNTLVGNRHFWNSDYMVHRRPEWYAAVRMNSVRTRPIEDDVNWDNALGRYFSDGVCLVMRTGLEYDNITACWDWTRLPGTTLPATPIYTEEDSRKIGLTVGGNTPRWTLSKQFRQLGESVFTGGVTDGKHGAAIYTQNLDGVQAQKAYFFDTDAIWQLGSGIVSDSPYEVATTVNTALLNGGVEQGENWFVHDGIGYRGEEMKLFTGEREGDWRYLEGGLKEPQPEKKNIFSLVIDHGLQPQNASYAFTILPGADAKAVAAWNRGKILANTDHLQAVEFEDGTVGAVFHAPGKLGSFETAAPGIFLIGQQRLYAADPTAKLKTMQVRIDGKVITIDLPKGEFAGKTVEIPLD